MQKLVAMSKLKKALQRETNEQIAEQTDTLDADYKNISHLLTSVMTPTQVDRSQKEIEVSVLALSESSMIYQLIVLKILSFFWLDYRLGKIAGSLRVPSTQLQSSHINDIYEKSCALRGWS